MGFFSFKKTTSSSVSSPKFTQYVDPAHEFTSNQLAVSLWYVRHKPELYQILKIGLIIASMVLWGFSIWQWGGYIMYTFQSERAFERSLTAFPDYTAITTQFAAQPLKVSGTEAFQSGVQKYDLIAEVTNPNSRFIADFDYYFSLEGATTSPEHTFLLPGEYRPVASLGLDINNGSFGTPVIHFQNIQWRRLDNKEFVSPRNFQDERLQFKVSNVMFNRAETIEGPTAHRLIFDLTNKSAYGYKAATFYVGLYLQQSLIGIMRLDQSNLKSLETRTIDLRSFAPDLNVTDVQVFPEINVYDEGVYLKPS
jgi:hypothetical protein